MSRDTSLFGDDKTYPQLSLTIDSHEHGSSTHDMLTLDSFVHSASTDCSSVYHCFPTSFQEPGSDRSDTVDHSPYSSALEREAAMRDGRVRNHTAASLVVIYDSNDESVESKSAEGIHAAITPVLKDANVSALQPGKAIDTYDTDLEPSSRVQMHSAIKSTSKTSTALASTKTTKTNTTRPGSWVSWAALFEWSMVPWT